LRRHGSSVSGTGGTVLGSDSASREADSSWIVRAGIDSRSVGH